MRQRDDEERVILDATQMQLGAVRETVTKAVQESLGEAVTETAALKSLNKSLAANSPLLLDQAKTLGMQMLQHDLTPRLTDVAEVRSRAVPSVPCPFPGGSAGKSFPSNRTVIIRPGLEKVVSYGAGSLLSFFVGTLGRT